jgi:adenylate kinase family enzyme
MSEAPLALGRRVIVTGLAGSGKSTFSLALAVKTGLPVIHLDLHFWQPGWVAVRRHSV